MPDVWRRAVLLVPECHERNYRDEPAPGAPRPIGAAYLRETDPAACEVERMSPIKQPTTFKDIYTPLGLCPCGKAIGASVAFGSVFHAFPPCPKFAELEPDEFLAYVRRSRGIPDKEDKPQ